MNSNFDNNIEETSQYRLINVVFLVTVLFYMGVSMTFGGYIYHAFGLSGQMIFSQLLLVMPGIGYLILTRQSFTRAIRLKPLRLAQILLVMLLAVLLMPFMSFMNAVSMMFTSNRVAVSMQEMSELPLIFSLFVVGVIPAFFEETIYRGIFYNEYRKISVRKGILLSGFLFGLMHLNLNQFCYAFAMGCAFAVVIEVTDSILSAMIIHFIINGSSTLVTYLVSEIPAMTEPAEAQLLTLPEVFQVGAVAIVPTGLAVLVLLVLAKISGRKQVWSELTRPEKKTRLVTLPLLAGILICVGYIVLVEIMI